MANITVKIQSKEDLNFLLKRFSLEDLILKNVDSLELFQDYTNTIVDLVLLKRLDPIAVFKQYKQICGYNVGLFPADGLHLNDIQLMKLVDNTDFKNLDATYLWMFAEYCSTISKNKQLAEKIKNIFESTNAIHDKLSIQAVEFVFGWFNFSWFDGGVVSSHFQEIEYSKVNNSCVFDRLSLPDYIIYELETILKLFGVVCENRDKHKYIYNVAIFEEFKRVCHEFVSQEAHSILKNLCSLDGYTFEWNLFDYKADIWATHIITVKNIGVNFGSVFLDLEIKHKDRYYKDNDYKRTIELMAVDFSTNCFENIEQAIVDEL